MPTVGEDFNLENMGHGGHGRKKGVILNANGQVVAHIWGHAKVVDANFRFVPRRDAGATVQPSVSGDEAEGDSLF